MSRTLLRSFLLFIAVFISGSAMGLEGSPSLAASTGAGCPSGTVCNRALGVALIPPSSWQTLPPGSFPPPALAFFVGPPRGAVNRIRLVIRSDGTTRERNDAHAAVVAANALTRGYSRLAMLPPLVRVPVQYGGAPGIMIRNLPGQPTMVLEIVLEHRGALYSIIAPGSHLASDQRQALASLRFIARVGPFPGANPPPPLGSSSVPRVPGPVFTGRTLILTRRTGVPTGGHIYSAWFNARSKRGWLLTYHVPCKGANARLVVDIENASGRVVDRVLHRRGSALHVSQMEELTGIFRLDVTSSCSRWRVTVSGLAP
jgi:hypothetical protein